MPIDWAKAARLAAAGVKTAEIATTVGCSRSQLNRRQRYCCLFRALTEQYAAATGGAPPARPPSAAPQKPIAEAVREKLEREILDGNTRVALWVAEQLRLFAQDNGQDSQQKLRDLLSAMTDAERAAFTRPD